MALDLEARMRVYLASAPQTEYPVQVLSFSHSAFTQPWHVWHEPRAGQVRTETGALLDVLCVNFEIELAGTPANLDQSFQIALDTTDIEDKFREEIDRVPMDSVEPVVVEYSEYLSSDLEHPTSYVALEALTMPFKLGAAAITAAAPRFNVSRTGETYSPADIPMLRGFI